jgi:arginase
MEGDIVNATLTDSRASTLRLVWPQWQGAGRDMVAHLMPGVPLDQARRGYMTGTAVLQAILPPHDGPTANVPVTSPKSIWPLTSWACSRE